MAVGRFSSCVVTCHVTAPSSIFPNRSATEISNSRLPSYQCCICGILTCENTAGSSFPSRQRQCRRGQYYIDGCRVVMTWRHSTPTASTFGH
jgi:hypothetical protein